MLFRSSFEPPSDEEYSAARATVNNAFYTSPEIAMCINSALVQFGFKGGNVLEPSMGIGNFFGSMPAPMQQSKLYGVELDSISGRIAKQLYQNANISITGFENTTYPDNFFDVVMGNVPFGDYKIFDPKYNKYNFRIHDYFLAKALDQARPGGMVAVITTKGTLDKSNPTIRKYLAERAELVGAIRLPNTAFKDNAGTEVTADILFLQKRERKIDIEPDWVHLGVTGDGIAVNSYFAEHPEMMLGTMQYDTRMFGQDSKYTVCVNNDENFNLYEALNKAISNIKAQMTDFERLADNEEQTEEVIPADPDVRNYTYTFFEGKLYYRENSEMVRQKVSPTAEGRIKSLDEIRQITRELIDIQMEGCSDEELADKQQLLNVKYDKFVGKYGAITSKANRTAFRDDSDYPLLCSLEEVNEDGEVKKADMFYKQTIKAKSVVDRVETAVEALNVSVNEFGYVNIPYMLSIYETDRDTLIKELDGIIFLNPDRYNENNPDAGWETADEYLSGNVRDKLRVAKAMAADTDDPQAERFAANAAALEKVQPEWIEASDIDVKTFKEANNVLYKSAWKSQFLSGLMMPIMQFVGNLGYAGVAISGGILAIKNVITIGDIQAFIQYVKNFTQPIQQIAQVANQLQSMAAASERVFEFLEEEEEDITVENPVKPDHIEGSVEFSHVHFGYNPDQIIINDFSANVKPGQQVAIVGPTGAGKTTMVKLLMRFYDVSSGAILVDGHDIRDYNRADLRDAFGMVLQDTWLFKGTIMENIRYGRLDATDEEVIAAAKAAHAHHFIQTLPGGYDMELNEDASNVSQGQKQLLTIARAILADNPILILDEATSSVDTRTEIRIQKALDNLMRGRTSFVIAHRLSTIKNADMILVMKDGDIIEQGTHDELLAKNGFYAELYNSQFEE